MMSGIKTDMRSWAQLYAMNVGSSPIGNISVVEGWFEELVLKNQPLIPTEALVDLTESVGQSLLSISEVALSRIVRPVSEPDLQIGATDLVHDGDAFEDVSDRLVANFRIDVRQTAEFVVLVLECVAVHRAEGDALVISKQSQLFEVVHPVPRNVEGHRRC